jgi:hypothetical protein
VPWGVNEVSGQQRATTRDRHQASSEEEAIPGGRCQGGERWLGRPEGESTHNTPRGGWRGRPFAMLRVTAAGSRRHAHLVMLSVVKHLSVQDERPFAAAQGDTVRHPVKPLGRPQGSPLPWTYGPGQRLRSRVGAIPCGRPLEVALLICTETVIRQQSPSQGEVLCVRQLPHPHLHKKR